MAVAERLQRGGALCLALVAMDREGLNARALQEAHDAVGAMLGAGEDQRAVDLLGLQHDMQQCLLFCLVDEGQLLADALGRGRLRRDADLDRIIEELAGQRLDLLGHGGREEQVLAIARQQLGDALQRVDEAHVHHLVGLVEDEDFRVLDGEGALVDQVKQTAGGGDDDVDAGRQGTDLLVDRHAAEHGFHRQAQETAIIAEALGDLGSQLAGRRQHQHATALDRRRLGIAREIVEAGQREGCGFAGAGLGDAAQVAAFQQDRNGLLLDRRRLGIFLGGQRPDDWLGKTKFIEMHEKLTSRPGANLSADAARAQGGLGNDPRE